MFLFQLQLYGSNYASNILSRWYRKWSAAKSERQTSKLRFIGNVVAFNISIVHLQVCSIISMQFVGHGKVSNFSTINYLILLDHFRTVEHQPKQQMVSTIGWAKCNIASSFKRSIDSIRSMHLKTAWRSYFNVANTVEHSFTMIIKSRYVMSNLAPKMHISQWCCIIITIIVFVIWTPARNLRNCPSTSKERLFKFLFIFFICIQNCCQNKLWKENWRRNLTRKREVQYATETLFI